MGIRSGRLLAILFTLLSVGGCSWILINKPQYGENTFIYVPAVAGFLFTLWRYVPHLDKSTSLARTLRGATYLMAGAFLVLLLLGLEGAVCIIMAAPLVYGAIAAGALIAMLARRLSRGDQGKHFLSVAASAALLLTTGTDTSAPRSAPLFQVNSFVDVHASPEEVWRHVISRLDFPRPENVSSRVGVGYPIRIRVIGEGTAAVRYCQFTTGTFVQPVTVWEPGRKLAFVVAENPPPMREWNPFHEVHPPHLEGYVVAEHGELELKRLTNGHTRLIGRTWYRHHLYPAMYWSWWTDGMIKEIHHRVLTQMKMSAEKGVLG